MPNTGTISGLSASTEYVLDAVHVDAFGNVSNVVSSSAFITGTAPATSITFMSAGDLGTATAATIAGALASAGAYALGLFTDDPSIADADVQFSGVAADQIVKTAGSDGGNVQWHLIDAAMPGDIVVNTVDATRGKSYGLFRLSGFTRTGLISAVDDGRGPVTLGSVPDGAAVLVVAGAASGTTPGVPDITATDTTEDGIHGNFPTLAVNSGTKSGTGTVTASFVNGANRYGIAAIALPVA